jgi:hypothetical protein
LNIDYRGGEELQAVIGVTIQSEDKDAKILIVGDSFGTMVALRYVLFVTTTNKATYPAHGVEWTYFMCQGTRRPTMGSRLWND